MTVIVTSLLVSRRRLPPSASITYGAGIHSLVVGDDQQHIAPPRTLRGGQQAGGGAEEKVFRLFMALELNDRSG
ncbi:MAG: hypothetical protein ACR2L2_15925 [Acidobacteriota bacterium]